MRITALASLVLACVALPAWASEHKGPPITADIVSVGKTLYDRNCAACHGANLEGQPDWRSRNPDGTLPAPPHDVSGHTWHHDDGTLFQITKHGGASIAPEGFKSGMPAFGETLSDGRIWAILTYIKSTWPADALARQTRVTEQANQTR